MPCSLEKMLAQHNQSMFEYLTPRGPHRGGRPHGYVSPFLAKTGLTGLWRKIRLCKTDDRVVDPDLDHSAGSGSLQLFQLKIVS